MSLPRAALATILSGVGYGAAFPPLGWWWLAWVTLVPFFWALDGARVGRAAGLGALWGVTAAYATGTWMPRAITLYYEQPLALGIAGFAACALITVAPYSAAFALLYRRIAPRPGAATALAIAAAWTAAELGRANSPLGNPWSLLGYSQAARLHLVQIADLTGVLGPSFVVALGNAAITRPRTTARAPWPLFVVVAAVLLYGSVRLDRVRDAAPARVAVVQGNLDLGTQWRPEFYGANLESYLRLSDEALAATPSRLVVWPEGTLTFFLEEDPSYRNAIGLVLSRHRVELLTGGPRSRGAGAALRYLNAAYLLQPDGEIAAVYEKERLLPFAEYFPLPGLDLVRRRFGRVREFVPGNAGPPLPTAVGAAGIMICNEALYGDIASARTREGAEFLVNLTNDTWGGEGTYAAIAFAMSRLRAVEQRRWLVRSSTSGPSAIVSPTGEVVAQADAGRRAVVSAEIAPRRDRTPYARAGDAFGWLCAVAAVATAVRGVDGRRT